MSDDEVKARPRDLHHIEVDEPDEVAYWTEALEVDEATLRGAIQAVGFGTSDVRDYLKWRHMTTRTT